MRNISIILCIALAVFILPTSAIETSKDPGQGKPVRTNYKLLEISTQPPTGSTEDAVWYHLNGKIKTGEWTEFSGAQLDDLEERYCLPGTAVCFAELKYEDGYPTAVICVRFGYTYD